MSTNKPVAAAATQPATPPTQDPVPDAVKAEPAAPVELDLTELTLDEARSYGSVHGETEHGISFEQDGLPYDHSGALIVAALDGVTKQKATRLLKQRIARAAAQAAYEEAMGADADPAARVTVNDGNHQKNTDVDVIAWAKGSVRYRFDLVATAMQKLWDEKPVNKEDALDMLRTRNMI